MIVCHDEKNVWPIGGMQVSCEEDKQQAERDLFIHQDVFLIRCEEVYGTIIMDLSSQRRVGRNVVEIQPLRAKPEVRESWPHNLHRRDVPTAPGDRDLSAVPGT
jgi:hypothetical protein